METLKNLFRSKKFIVLVASAAVYALSRFGFDVSQEDAEKFVLLASAYLVGQGIADHGKEAKRIEGASP